MREPVITIFKNIYPNPANYISVDKALERIRSGKSQKQIELIRRTLDEEKADALKKQLPSVCFSGKFPKERTDDSLIDHSGFICLDFDKVSDIGEKMADVCGNDFVYAAWVSPRGSGIKALVKIADKSKHREHFQALQDKFPDTDPTSINVSRVCFESYDPNMYTNKAAKPFTKTKVVERVKEAEAVSEYQDVFRKLLVWLSNRSDAFVSGERNVFIFKLASACCRFGLDEDSATRLIINEFPIGGTFSEKECTRTIKSAYRTNKNKSGTAHFEREVLVDKVTKGEVKIDAEIYDTSVRPKDVVYGIDVKEQAIEIFRHGYPSVLGIGVKDLDDLFKPKRGEITLLSGHGNYGKSRFKKWYQVLRAILYDEKFATFPPEDYPIHNFYHDLTEILLGCDCSNGNPYKPKESIFEAAYDFISAHFFYIYPTSLAPTPEYVKERFLELLIKEGVDGCDIDPFNQMTNDYGAFGGRSDKYLETTLSDLARFGQVNNLYMWIVAHPVKMKLGADNNYPCPNVYDIADGAMWNNKMDNILMYHRPFMQSNPDDNTCEFHSKKIRDQKVVGKKGFVLFEYKRRTRRYIFNGIDVIEQALKDKGIVFNHNSSENPF